MKSPIQDWGNSNSKSKRHLDEASGLPLRGAFAVQFALQIVVGSSTYYLYAFVASILAALMSSLI